MIGDVPDHDAIVLAGGAGRRLGGVDKATLRVGEQSLLDRALAAVADARTIVVVGPDRSVPEDVTVVCEDPPGGGPVAAIEAGLALVTSAVVVVLACDMPRLRAEHVRRLVDVPPSSAGYGADVVMFVDHTGRRQPLAAAYRMAALSAAIRSLAPTRGRAVHDLIGLLTVAEIPADAGSTADVDTWADMAETRTLMEDR